MGLGGYLVGGWVATGDGWLIEGLGSLLGNGWL
jgi:hypothetical protein